MKLTVGIFEGAHPEKVHARHGVEERPTCHAYSNHAWREWFGSLREVDCRRCLAVLRAAKLRDVNRIERRIQGKDGIQVDAFEARL